MATGIKATQFLHAPFFICFNETRRPTTFQALKAQSGSCLRKCLRGTHATNKWSKVGFTLAQRHLVFVSISLYISRYKSPSSFLRGKECLWKAWSSHLVWMQLTKSGACEMILKGMLLMDNIHVLNLSQWNRQNSAPTTLPWHFLSEGWWHFFPSDSTKWVSNLDLL